MAFLDITSMFLITDDYFFFKNFSESWVFCVISLDPLCVKTKFHLKETAVEIIKHILHELSWRGNFQITT